ncbi:MAG TPA: lysophospholipid acyltransferase family protein [Anaerolineales bacterium]|nr:lysophospholipid acyltransferase family protein [Anaerolineales bacterium]
MKSQKSSTSIELKANNQTFVLDQVILLILKIYARLFQRHCIVKGNINLPPGPKIIAINHTDGCDPLFLPLVLNEKPYFLLQDSLFTIPIIGWLLRQSGQIPVYRGTEKAKEAFWQACELLRQGKTIVIFPEGKIVPAGQRIPAKTGAIRMALETGAPIIPLAIYAHLEDLIAVQFNWRGSRRSGLLQLSGKSYMRFGTAWKPDIHPLNHDQSNVHALTDELMNRIYELVSQIERETLCESRSSLNPIPQW